MHSVLIAVLCLVLPRTTSSQAIEVRPAQSSSGSHVCDFTHLHPRRYAAYHLPPPRDQFLSSISIDGVLDEQVWAEVPWSEPFQDIRGSPFWSQPWFTTKFKLRYDQKFLYIGAYIEETEVWANVSRRNEVIFHDNDFEVFVDADGSTHNYKEFEMNARNCTWNLWLNRPYRDGGHENSTRVDPHHGFDMLNGGMQSAVFVKGPISDPSERLHYWTAEIALPLLELASHSHVKVPPAPNSYWRINFSRVEWPVRVVTDGDTGLQHFEKKAGLREENWVWSAQYAVDMHRPEWWGYLQFRPQGQPPSMLSNEVPLDPEWGVRYVSFQFYYAQHAFHNATGTYTSNLEKLLPYFTSREAIECTKLIDMSATDTSFSAQIGLRTGVRGVSELIASIEQDGYITVDKINQAADLTAIA
ncbi:Carbohydrate family 9 binding domain-like [Phytophthora infestans]|uniref:Carbohydrate family 9 binding domain-like n=1 Tax=Phytophthora infestans TaxID=4787 RepID=A0A8S9UJZ4_PHYIN|nr:Carbohydrate family 9 binding domain-like [Phytophthora infestans]